MITDLELINAINNRKLRVMSMGFETTRRCNLRCPGCYKDNAQAVDLDPKVAKTVLENFNVIDHIRLYGGESQTSPEGLAFLNDELGKNKTIFNRLSFITNGTIVNKEFFKILKDIESKAQKTGDWKIGIGISNDYMHNEGMESVGIDKKVVYKNYKKMMNLCPSFSINMRKYKGEEEFPLKAAGRALGDSRASTEIFRNDLVMRKKKPTETRHVLFKIQTDAKGNIIQEMREYDTGEEVNFGNVLKTPVNQTLIEKASVGFVHEREL